MSIKSSFSKFPKKKFSKAFGQFYASLNGFWLTDSDGSRLEWGDVQWDQSPRDRGWGQEGDVLFHLLHHPGGVWQLYPNSLISDTLKLQRSNTITVINVTENFGLYMSKTEITIWKRTMFLL